MLQSQIVSSARSNTFLSLDEVLTPVSSLTVRIMLLTASSLPTCNFKSFAPSLNRMTTLTCARRSTTLFPFSSRLRRASSSSSSSSPSLVTTTSLVSSSVPSSSSFEAISTGSETTYSGSWYQFPSPSYTPSLKFPVGNVTPAAVKMLCAVASATSPASPSPSSSSSSVSRCEAHSTSKAARTVCQTSTRPVTRVSKKAARSASRAWRVHAWRPGGGGDEEDVDEDQTWRRRGLLMCWDSGRRRRRPEVRGEVVDAGGGRGDRGGGICCWREEDRAAGWGELGPEGREKQQPLYDCQPF